MKNHWFSWKIMKNHIWHENFNLHTGVSIFCNSFSSKNHQKSWIFIKKWWWIQNGNRALDTWILMLLWRKAWNMTDKNIKTKRAFFIRSRNIFGPKIILFFRFWNSIISCSLNIFDEKRSSKWCIFFPERLGWLGWAKHSLEL